MSHTVFKPRTAVREEKRQAYEAVGRSFCKTLAEPITNSDSSGKRNHKIPQTSGLVELMFKVPKGTQLDTTILRSELLGKYPKRVITVDVVTAKSSGRPAGEIVITDQAEGMSADSLRKALEDIAGDRADLAHGMTGRNLFGRGLSDVMRAHSDPIIHTYDGNELTIAHGEWRNDGWTIQMDDFDKPTKTRLKEASLDPTTSGTSVRIVIKDRSHCHIPDNIAQRLANFYMLRLIASDPNVELNLRHYRANGLASDRIEYNFPPGQVIESCSRTFDAPKHGFGDKPLTVDFLLVRVDSHRPLRGAGVDRDARENGLLIVDDLDAAYDLTFADPDYEQADFLSRIYGIVRVNGLREICEQCLNDPVEPTSPLRPDRDGFKDDHDFARALLHFIVDALRPTYEKERKLAQEKERGKLSAETKKRIDDALKHLNKYFHDVTELDGFGSGDGEDQPKKPAVPVSFYPQTIRPIASHPRQVLLLVDSEAVNDGAEVVVSASEGFTVQPETERISRKECPRWTPHEQFFSLRFSVLCTEVGRSGTVDAVVEGKNGDLLEARLIVEDVLTEREIEVPATLEFRPQVATGGPNRKNNLVLYLNPEVISVGHYVRIRITESVGDVKLIGENNVRVEQVDIKLDESKHGVKGQKVFRVLVPWKGTSWNQHAHVTATVKAGGPKPLTATARIRLDAPEEGGFFKDVKYDDLGQETSAPSMFAASIITVNARDSLNKSLFGEGPTAEELKSSFDRNLRENGLAQQRLAHLLLEEASFRALEHWRLNNNLHLRQQKEVTDIHKAVDKYKYESALAVHRALVKLTS